MSNFNMQLHGDLVSLMEQRTEGFEIVRNTKAEVWLEKAESRVTSMIPATLCGTTYSFCTGCLCQRKLGT